MAEALHVGIIGINAERGWAREAHAPAVQHVDGLELAAVATRTQASADAAAAVFGIGKAYGDPAGLIADPHIDVVAVTAAVPAHRELILAALAAGRHVLTEWPVAVGTEATAEIAAVAARSGRRTAVGLQARTNPAAVRAGELIAAGTLGRIRSVRALSTTAAFGPVIGPAEISLEDPSTGMNLTTIQVAHTMDLVGSLTGALVEIGALRAVQYPNLGVEGRDAPLHRVLPDHVLVQGRLADGGLLTVEVIGGRAPGDTPFRLEIEGENGSMTLTGGALRGFQSGVLDLVVDGESVDLPADGLPASVVNVAGLYTALRDDIRSGTSTAPSFTDAERLSHLVDDLIRSDDEQRIVRLGAQAASR